MKEFKNASHPEIIRNKYYECYQMLIERAILEPRSHLEYYEVHHILPRALGGSDDSENLVALSAREHFIAHHLLWRFTIGHANIKMTHAFKMMSDSKGFKVFSKTYEKLKKIKSEETIKMNKERALSYLFVHEEYGEFYGTVSELIEKYPVMDYHHGCFYSLIRGTMNWYRGWSLNEYKERYRKISELDTKVMEWKHRVHGLIKCTAKTLIEKYDLDQGGISGVLYELKLSHKGWYLKENFMERSERDKVYIFYHPIHGKFEGKTTDLVQNYPETNVDGLNEMIRGKNTNHYGWSLEPNKKVLRNNIYKFVHKEHGERYCTVKALLQEFPNLAKSPIRRLTTGDDLVYKGWFLNEIKDIPNSYKWYHKDFGEFEGTISDLYYEYPEQKLDRSGLTKVVKGKNKSCKGWKILTE